MTHGEETLLLKNEMSGRNISTLRYGDEWCKEPTKRLSVKVQPLTFRDELWLIVYLYEKTNFTNATLHLAMLLITIKGSFNLKPAELTSCDEKYLRITG